MKNKEFTVRAENEDGEVGMAVIKERQIKPSTKKRKRSHANEKRLEKLVKTENEYIEKVKKISVKKRAELRSFLANENNSTYMCNMFEYIYENRDSLTIAPFKMIIGTYDYFLLYTDKVLFKYKPEHKIVKMYAFGDSSEKTYTLENVKDAPGDLVWNRKIRRGKSGNETLEEAIYDLTEFYETILKEKRDKIKNARDEMYRTIREQHKR